MALPLQLHSRMKGWTILAHFPRVQMRHHHAAVLYRKRAARWPSPPAPVRFRKWVGFLAAKKHHGV